MDRKYKSGAAGSPPALDNASDGFPTPGNPGTGTPATKPGSHMLYMLVEEPMAVILAGGITPDKTVVTQMRDSMQAMFSGGPVVNGRITVTHNAGTHTWTIALKTLSGADASATTPIFIAFRHATAADGSRVMRTVTAALSMLVSSGSTLGHSSATNQDIFVYLIDNAGTVELAVSKLSPSTDGTTGSARLISTTAEGGAGAADSGTVIYSTTARSNVPWVCVARAVSNQTVAGTWDAAAVLIDMAPFIVATFTEPPSVPGGRLTLTTAVPVTTSDVTAATTIYYTPYQSDRVQLYNGTLWTAVQFSELSQATTDNTKSPAAAANNSNYDMFVWSDSGTIRCTRGPAWSSDTARGTGAGTTELELFEGRLVNKVSITNGPAARRGLYVGTVGTNGSAQANDSYTTRMIWNCYNRVRRPMRRFESADNWSQGVGAYRQANASTANQLDVITGLNDEMVTCSVNASSSYAGGIGTADIAIGLDSTTAAAPGSSSMFQSRPSGFPASLGLGHFVSFSDFVGLGRHSLVWLESSGSATVVWFGDQGGAKTGMLGSIRS